MRCPCHRSDVYMHHIALQIQMAHFQIKVRAPDRLFNVINWLLTSTHLHPRLPAKPIFATMAYVPTSHTHPPTAAISIEDENALSVVDQRILHPVERIGDPAQLLNLKQAADERPDGIKPFFGAGGARYGNTFAGDLLRA
jgi:hypothetical protein